MEKFGALLDLTLERAMVPTEKNPIIFSEAPIHNKDNRLKLTEYMFEKYNIPGMFICKNAVLSA